MHHHLIKEKTRTRVGLIVESGDARETHHVALLVGYGAAAICPYLAIETVRDLAAAGELVSASGQAITPDRAEKNLIKALGKGVLKVMSKMGVSTVASYTGAQIFEAIGLGDEVIGTCFAGTASRLGGVGFSVLAEEAARRAAVAAGGAGLSHRRLEIGGEYQWRREGEPHLFSPETVFKLQHATRSRRYEIFKEYTSLIDDQSAKLKTLRGLLRIKGIDEQGEPRVRREGSHRRSRAGRVDRAAVRHRGDVLRVDLRRGARDPGHRDEPARRPVQHRRGRRGPRPVQPRPQRRPAALRRQAGGVRPVRRDQRVPGQRR